MNLLGRDVLCDLLVWGIHGVFQRETCAIRNGWIPCCNEIGSVANVRCVILIGPSLVFDPRSLPGLWETIHPGFCSRNWDTSAGRCDQLRIG